MKIIPYLFSLLCGAAGYAFLYWLVTRDRDDSPCARCYLSEGTYYVFPEPETKKSQSGQLPLTPADSRVIGFKTELDIFHTCPVKGEKEGK